MTQTPAGTQLTRETQVDERDVVSGRAPGTPFVLLLGVAGTLVTLVVLGLLVAVVAGWIA